MHPGQATCGAKTRKGRPCKDIAMKNGRCKRHGGKSTGPITPKPLIAEANGAHKYGIYGNYFRPHERELIDANALKVGDVEAELTVVRIRLRRTLEAREAWEASLQRTDPGVPVSELGDETAVMIEKVEDQSVSKDGDVYDTTKRTFRLPDFDAIIDRCLARIESLEKTRKELVGDGGGGGTGIEIVGGLPDED